MHFRTVNIGNFKIGHYQPVRIMGVINLSPESFYNGSIVTDNENLIDVVHKIERDGADFIDVGAASTAPKEVYDTPSISVEVELSRIEEAMRIIRDSTKLPISIDTTSSKVAEIALNLGADFVNDVSGFSADTMMAQLVSERNVPIILMSSCDGPCLSLQASIESIKLSLERAKSNGVPADLIIIDPGIGFGKSTDVDLAILKNLREFTNFGFPVLVGVSRKAFIGELLDLPNPVERLTGTIAATSIAVANGANVIRAHDVKEAKMAARIGESLRTTDTKSKENVILFEALDEKEAEIIIESIGTSPSITKSLSKKSLILNVLVSGLKTAAALIIKQEMLALGGDAAYHHDVIDSKIDSTDMLIMGTPLQLQRLSNKIATMTYFGLNRLSKVITQLLAEREKDIG